MKMYFGLLIPVGVFVFSILYLADREVSSRPPALIYRDRQGRTCAMIPPIGAEGKPLVIGALLPGLREGRQERGFCRLLAPPLRYLRILPSLSWPRNQAR
jgi:hypothetical protein